MKTLGAALMILGGSVVLLGGLRSEGFHWAIRIPDLRPATAGTASIPPSPVAGLIPLALGAGMLLRDSWYFTTTRRLDEPVTRRI